MVLRTSKLEAYETHLPPVGVNFGSKCEVLYAKIFFIFAKLICFFLSAET